MPSSSVDIIAILINAHADYGYKARSKPSELSPRVSRVNGIGRTRRRRYRRQPAATQSPTNKTLTTGICVHVCICSEARSKPPPPSTTNEHTARAGLIYASYYCYDYYLVRLRTRVANTKSSYKFVNKRLRAPASWFQLR